MTGTTVGSVCFSSVAVELARGMGTVEAGDGRTVTGAPTGDIALHRIGHKHGERRPFVQQTDSNEH